MLMRQHLQITTNATVEDAAICKWPATLSEGTFHQVFVLEGLHQPLSPSRAISQTSIEITGGLSKSQLRGAPAVS